MVNCSCGCRREIEQLRGAVRVACFSIAYLAVTLPFAQTDKERVTSRLIKLLDSVIAFGYSGGERKGAEAFATDLYREIQALLHE